MTPDPSRLPVASLDVTYCRVMREVYPPLDTGGARRYGGRFNPPGISALYLAQDPELALREGTRSADWAAFHAFAPRRIVCVRVRLSQVFDLRDERTREACGISMEDVQAQWAALAAPSNTQILGELSAMRGIEGILYPSALDRTRSNLVIFPDNLLPGSRLEIVAND